MRLLERVQRHRARLSQQVLQRRLVLAHHLRHQRERAPTPESVGARSTADHDPLTHGQREDRKGPLVPVWWWLEEEEEEEDLTCAAWAASPFLAFVLLTSPSACRSSCCDWNSCIHCL